MPKKIPRELPQMPNPEEQELTEEEAEAELVGLEQKKAGLMARKTPPLRQPRQPIQRQPIQQQPQAPAVRYTAFKQPEAEGIIDAETKEVIATDMWTVFANIMERLERIENSIGSMLEG